MKKYRCNKCKEMCCPYRDNKGLCPNNATSVLCNPTLLDKCNRLSLVAMNGKNKYYRVNNSNTVIMNVEHMYCELIDNMVTMYNQQTPSSLPQALKMFKYTMQRIRNRDWCQGGANKYLGEDIQRMVHGNKKVDLAKRQGLKRDHMAETYNEKVDNVEYNNNPVEKNHHVRVEIRSMKELDEFLDDIVAADKAKDGVYYERANKKKNTHGRNFVK